MTGEVADHGSVLLLNPGLVVLAVRPGTGELDAPPGAVLCESIVDEYAVVVLNQSQGGMCISGVLKTTEMTPRPLASPLGPKRVGTERPVERYVHFTLALV